MFSATVTPLPVRSASRWCLYASVFALAAFFRYLLLERGFPNDHFVYITGGWQWLSGEWPTRDWVDGGAPLMLAASALAQAVFGPTMLAEGVLVAVAFGLAAAVTAGVVIEWTGSLTLAAVASMLEIAVVPRTYSYPKVLIYAIAFLCFARYAKRPTTARLIAMAVVVATAFLFRHDHGVFIGVGALLTTVLAQTQSSIVRRQRVVTLLMAIAVLLSPYLIYLQVYEGFLVHARLGLGFGQRELSTQWGVWPKVFGDVTPFGSALFYWYYLIPIGAATLAVLHRDRGSPGPRVLVLPVAAVAMLMNLVFLRDPLDVRLPDPIVPALVLGAWMVQRTLSERPRRTVALLASAAGIALFAASVLEAGTTIDSLDQADLVHDWRRTPELVRLRTMELSARLPERVWPSRASASLVPFYRYLDRCTTDEHRLLIGGFLVEVPFFARRRFAGGQRYFAGSYGFDEAAERRALLRLDRQVVPFALVPSDYAETLPRAYPLLAERIRTRYIQLVDVLVPGGQRIAIYLDSTIAATGRDVETGWPCYR